LPLFVRRNLAGFNSDDAIKVFVSKVRLMQRAQQCKAVLVCQAAKKRKNLPAQNGIKGGHRFIGEQYQGLLHQGPRDSHSLVFASRKIRRPRAQLAFQGHAGKRSFGFLQLGGRWPQQKSQGADRCPSSQRSGHHVLVYAQSVHQIVPLGNQAYLGTQVSQLAAAQAAHFNSIHANASRNYGKKSIDSAKQRCFARAAGPKDGDLLASLYAQGDLIQHAGAFVVTANNKVTYLKHGDKWKNQACP
jgi:hypothetical protein